MGKPVAADLKLGLATAPVLFAAEQVGCSFSVTEMRQHYCKNFFYELNTLCKEYFEFKHETER